jgi:hypothetical protein
MDGRISVCAAQEGQKKRKKRGKRRKKDVKLVHNKG